MNRGMSNFTYIRRFICGSKKYVALEHGRFNTCICIMEKKEKFPGEYKTMISEMV